MENTKLGNSGVDVTKYSLGTVWYGTRYDKKQTFELLDFAYEKGITFLDTANIYSFWIEGFKGGESETLIGEWMKDRGNRDELTLLTKVGIEYPGTERGLKADQIETECERSLKRLGTDRIDVYMSHADDPNTPLEETLGAFDKLVKAGKVRVLGASNFTVARLEESLSVSKKNNLASYYCLQQKHSYVRPNPESNADMGLQIAINEEMKTFCQSNDVSIMAYSPQLAGLYSRLDGGNYYVASDSYDPNLYKGKDTDERLDVLREVSSELGAKPGQVVLAWMLHSAYHIIPLVAASKTSQMQESIEALTLKLTPEIMKRLDDAGSL